MARREPLCYRGLEGRLSMKIILATLVAVTVASSALAASDNCQWASLRVTQAIIEEAKQSDRGILAASLFAKYGGGEAFMDGLAEVYEEDVCLYIRNTSGEAMRKMADTILTRHANGEY
jgi:hypothetical protein